MNITTTDGHCYTDTTLACLIGASLPTPTACQEAVALLREALNVGVSQQTLWQITGIAVWDGLHVAREVLERVPGQPAFPGNGDRIIFANLGDEAIE